VLIEGPTGSGKELFAKAIHNLSTRSDRRYVAVNCGALPDSLLESELFGYRRGAFTDAHKDKPGRFALAEGGTMLLDEIGDLSTALQVKLLRVLQEREYEPLGATAPVKTDVRIIAATNQPFRELVARGVLREDLYYRLNVLKIVLPPLARRREDIPLLVDHFLRTLNARLDKQIDGVSEDVLEVLMKYEFPGNVRELENVIERAAVLGRGNRIELDCLPVELRQSVSQRAETAETAHGGLLVEAEASAILDALRRHDGHRRKTATALGIDKSTLWRKMQRFGISYP
jgi:transcriptional regulator with PAS, ATPase and Fis domain